MNFSNYQEEKIITDYLITPTVYLAIFGNLDGGTVTKQTVLDELESNTLTNEITTYTGDRPTVTFTTVIQNVDGKAETTNDNIVSFADMPACEIYVAAVMDALTAGNVIVWLEPNAEQIITVGDPLDVGAESIIITTD